MEERIDEIVKDIKIDKKKTTKYRRRLQSAPDSRLSSKCMGVTAGVVLVSVIMGIIALDSRRIAANIHIFWNTMHKIFRYWIVNIHVFCRTSLVTPFFFSVKVSFYLLLLGYLKCMFKNMNSMKKMDTACNCLASKIYKWSNFKCV